MKFAVYLLSAACFAASTINPPAAIQAEGVPPIAQPLMDELAQYNESRSAQLADWHPQKREMLITTRFGEVPQFHRVAMPGGARTQLTFGNERISGGRFDPSGRWFSYLRDVGGSEFYQLFVFDTKTGKSTMLSDGKSRNSAGLWSPDGTLMAYTSTRRNGKDTDIWLASPSNPAAGKMLLQTDSGGWFVQDWSPDGKRLAVELFVSADTASLFEIDLATSQKRLLTPDKPGVSYKDAHYAPGGRQLWARSNDGSDFLRITRIELGAAPSIQFRSELRWDVEAIELSEDGKLLAYVVNEDGADRVHILNAETGSLWGMAIPLPAGVAGGLRWRKGTHELGFNFGSAKSPNDIYSFDADSGKVERWTRSETGGLNAEEFVDPQIVRWKSFDSLTISGLYYKPPATFAGRRPVIINIHGGPEGQSVAGFLGRNNYYLNELGIALIYPNVRGSEGYGKKFLNLDNGTKREDSVRDIGALLDWIATQPDLDASRVMVTGGSYGGYMTLAVMTHYSDRIRCAVDVVGIANFVSFLEHTEAYRRDLRRVEYGDERDPKMRDFMLTIAPVRNVKNITRPMMIVAGRNDPRVPWTESQQMVDAIRQNKTPVWYLLAADEGHGFSKKRNQDYQFAATVLFAKKYLLNKEN